MPEADFILRYTLVWSFPPSDGLNTRETIGPTLKPSEIQRDSLPQPGRGCLPLREAYRAPHLPLNPPWGSSPFPSLPRENIQVVRHSVFLGGSADRKGLGHRKFYRNVSSSPIPDPALLWNLQIPQKGWQEQSVPPMRGVSWGAVSSGVR